VCRAKEKNRMDAMHRGWDFDELTTKTANEDRVHRYALFGGKEGKNRV